ncbi:MAG TPA: FlgO family outer membrane protein [Accumulibacter sp.]|nr:FlgO family outer membrane protein [Accumulibacter sp.]HMW17077.1 FlgO family outer membrane protein [Accumulibacter sp.]HNC18204.1 FlgO family outer membrane protein [Accumulibacter sp.]HND79878.1 FlgO family outer membrane protein [Accumulibacter sp.]HNE12273.1 FlgO family outer membrane protein [Accumulibacter sp.]
MKTLITLLLSLTALLGCVTPNYQAAQNSAFTQANYSAVDTLIASPALALDKDSPLLVATLVNIDAMNQSSRLGRLVSEQIATRLSQQGYSVVEMKLRNNVYIREGAGELLLSRDVRDLSKSHHAQAVVVGNYAVAATYVFLTLKIVSVLDNRVLAATNYLLPLTENNKALLASPSREG